MANRITTHILKNSDNVNRTLPLSGLLAGEPIVNIADGILYFSGRSTSLPNWVPAGPTSNLNSNLFEVGSNLYDLKLRNRITKYEGFEGSNLVGKFLSGTTSGFTLANISSIAGVDTFVTGFTYSPTTNTITLSQNIGRPELTLLINTMTGLTVNGILSAITSNSGTANINTLNATGGTVTTLGSTTANLNTANIGTLNATGITVTNNVTASAFIGNLTGTSLNTTNVGVTNNTTGNGTYYVGFVTGTTGNQPLQIDSNTLTFNPNTNTLTVANLSGLSSSATTLVTPNVTINSNGITANTISATTYQNVSHNNTTGLQGGTTNEYYHLTASQQSRVLNIIYIPQVTTFSASAVSLEKGSTTPVTLTYRMIANDDSYTGATINPLGYNLFPTFTDGTSRTTGFTQSTSASTITYTLNYGFTRNGSGNTASQNAILTTIVPQWNGTSSLTGFSANTYVAVNALGLTKTITGSTTQTSAFTANNQYLWFISQKVNASIFSSGLPNIVGALNVDDDTSEWIQKSVTITLNDTVTNSVVYTYRTRDKKNIITPITYILS